MTPSLQTLKAMFADRPDVVALFDRRELDLQGLTDAELAKTHRVRQLYPRPINLYVTGRTGAGKSSLGNRFLDGNPLPTTGYQDCTSVVQYFRLASNLVYFDLPGSGSSDAFENINRAAVLAPQLEDETPTPVVPLLDFTSALASNRRPTPADATAFPLPEWEGELCRQRFEADALLYVIAPHAKWLRPDREYLRAVLKARKAAGRSANVIFALNNHINPDGSPKATPQEMTDVQTKVAEEWEKVYPGTRPLMIEVNAITGKGMQALAEAMCRVLPPNKIGNMEQVLSSDLKAAATAERSRRYRGLIVALASRLATYRVDATAGRNELLKEAFAAICGYAVAVFHEEAAILEAQRGLLEVAVAAAAEVRKARTKAITVTQKDVVHREVQEEVTKAIIPKTEEVEVLEAVESLVTTEVKKSKSLAARMGIGLLEGVEHVFASPISAIELLGGAKRTENHTVRDRYRDSYSYTETVVRPTTTTVTRLEERIIGFEEQKELVTRLVPEVVSRQEVVGEQGGHGGARVIEDVFALALAAERVTSGPNFERRFTAAVADVRAEIKDLLEPFAQQIEADSVADQPTGEKELQALLTRVFVR
jgi:hypothetical protein